MLRLCTLVGLLSSAPPLVARAEPPPVVHPPGPADGPAPKVEPSALDDWSFIPILFYTPETSVGLGAAVIHSFDPSHGTASLSTLAAGVIVTANEQFIARFEPDVRFEDAYLHGVIRFQRYPTRFFAPGAHLGDAGEPYDELALWANLDARYRLAPRGRPWGTIAVGGRCDVQWNKVLEVEEGGRLDTLAPLGVAPWVGLGCGPVIAHDSRDDVRLPTRGAYLEGRLTGWLQLYGERFLALAGDVDGRAFIDLGKGHVLAGQLLARVVAGDLPFQIQPRLGGSMQLRGWFEGHLRDHNALLVQLEWRFPIVWDLLGAVFASGGAAFHRWSELGPEDARVGAGAGLRYLVNRKQTVTVRADVAWGSDLAVYVDVLEAF